MGLFSRKKIEPETIDPRNPQRKQADEFLARYLSAYGNQYQPGEAYRGQFTAPMSRFERRGLDQFLTGYLDQPDISSQLGDVRGLLNKTITGGFDPGTSPYYQALRDEARYNQGQALTDLRAGLGARGKYFSSEAVAKEGDIAAQTGIGLNKVLAELADRERSRQEAAIPQAAGLERYLSGIPLEKAQAATTIGALPRELEQRDLESLYQDFIRRQQEKGGVLNAAAGVSSTPLQQSYAAYKPSTFERFIAPLIQTGVSAFAGGGNPLSFFGGGGGGSNVNQLFAQMRAA